MKRKLFWIVAALAVFCLFSGAGTALAGCQYRGERHGYTKHGVVVHHGQTRVVHRHYVPVYHRTGPICAYPYQRAYVYPAPVIVKHAPVCAPLWGGWGFSLYFGY
jgi:hypothetical protein